MFEINKKMNLYVASSAVSSFARFARNSSFYMWSKLHNFLARKIKAHLYSFLVGLFVFSFWPNKALAYEFNLPPSRVVVPSVDVSLPIDTVPVSVDTWQVSLYGASFGEHTSMPGEKGGNTVIFAHAMPNLFGSLPNIKVGDEIHIFTNHDWLVYKTTETLVLEPTDVEVLKPNNNHDLTLYTCIGPNYSQRFVAKAKLVPVVL